MSDNFLNYTDTDSAEPFDISDEELTPPPLTLKERLSSVFEKAIENIMEDLNIPLPPPPDPSDLDAVKAYKMIVGLRQAASNLGIHVKLEAASIDAELSREKRLEQIRKEILYASFVIDREEWEELKKKAPFLQEPENPSPKSGDCLS